MKKVRRGKSLLRVKSHMEKFEMHWNGLVFGKRWARSANTIRAAKGYFMGILQPGERKSMEPIARRADINVDALNNFITESPWDEIGVMRTNTRIMKEKVSGPEGIIVIDETGIPKQGTESVGVARQYSGTLGKVANCQVAVSCEYVLPSLHRNRDMHSWPLGMKLYLPEEWARDQKRREKTGVPPDVQFQTKPQIGLSLLQFVREERVPHQTVVTDETYGNASEFRAKLREWKEPYIVGVSVTRLRFVDENTPLLPSGRANGKGRKGRFPCIPREANVLSAKRWASIVPEKDWKEVTWGEGTKGEMSGTFARLRVRVVKARSLGRGYWATDEVGWLLLEQTEDKLKAYFCWGLDGWDILELVRIAHTRWAIEQYYKEAKDELGLDHFEGRTWRGWNHHVTIVMMVYSFLVLLRAEQEEPPPSIPAIRREFLRLIAVQILIEQEGLSKKEATRVVNRLGHMSGGLS